MCCQGAKPCQQHVGKLPLCQVLSVACCLARALVWVQGFAAGVSSSLRDERCRDDKRTNTVFTSVHSAVGVPCSNTQGHEEGLKRHVAMASALNRI